MNKKGTHFSEEQMRAITSLGRPMLIVAGPGSGKTTVITHRIKYLIESAGVSPADILVITFTKAAAKEMETRFNNISSSQNNQVRFGTFHSIFYWIIKTAYKLDNSCIISEEEKRIMIDRYLSELGESYDNKDDIITSILSQISFIKSDMIDVDNYFSKDLPEEVFRSIYRKLDKEMKRNKKIDFDDMMVMCYELLKSRTDVLNTVRRLFKHILVDEFQDSNVIQYEILKLLVAPNNNVYVVGDDDQSVYGFRGARPEIMMQYKKDFPDVCEVHLGVNYRCDGNITKAATAVITKNKMRFDKKLTSNSTYDGLVQIIKTKNIPEENDILINMLKQHNQAGIPYERQAILYRTNIQPRRLLYRLNQFNIPYSISDTVPNIFEHFAVRNILDYMRIAMGDRTRSTFLRIINKPSRYISRDVFMDDMVDYDTIRYRLRNKDYLVENIDKLFADIKLMGKLKPFAACNFIRNFVGYDAYLKEYADYRQLDVTEFYDVLDEFASMINGLQSYGELFDFVDEYGKLLSKQKNGNKQNGVSLMTMHGSKGLEFDCVYIIDAVEGVTPYKKAKSVAELEEERRMFYVAMTRARHKLYIFAPEATTGGGTKRQSRYIDDIENSFYNQK